MARESKKNSKLGALAIFGSKRKFAIHRNTHSNVRECLIFSIKTDSTVLILSMDAGWRKHSNKEEGTIHRWVDFSLLELRRIKLYATTR